MSFEVSLVVKPAAILAVVSLLALVLRRASASALYGMWVLGMIGVLALPIAVMILPAVDLPVLPQQEIPSPAFTQTEAFSTLPPTTTTTALDGPMQTVAPRAAAIPWTWRHGVRLVWGLGFCIVILGWFFAMLELRRLRRTSAAVTESGWTDLLVELRQALSISSPVELRMSTRSVPPMTWGLLRPIILIPAQAEAWTIERRRLVLAHELGHVRRYDSLGQILCQSVCCIYWFNPLAWYAAHRLHVERERACDDIVLRLGARAADYADHLVQIARGMNAGFSWTVVSVAHPSQLKARIIAILDPRTRRQKISRLAACGFLTLVFFLTVSAAMIQLSALASMPLPAIAAVLPAPPLMEPPKAAVQAPAAPSLAGTALIEGRVTRGENDVIAGAAVELRPAAGGIPLAIVSDERGNFAFKDLPSGEYRLAATANGHVRSEYGQKRPNGPGLAISLRANQELKGVSLTLAATGAISGQIRGRNGLPAAHVQVHALQYGYEDGRRVLKTVRVLTTNDRGDYRLYWLPPGSYFLMAVPLVGDIEDTILIVGGDGTARGFTSVLQAPTGRTIVLPDQSSSIPIYYPGTIRPQDASSLELKPGEEKTGINMTLIDAQSFRVMGTLTNLPPVVPGNAVGPPTIATIRLQPLSPSVLERKSAPTGMGTVNLQTGAFEIRGVLPGAYNVVATAAGGGRNRTQLFGRVPVEVVNGDVANLRVSLVPAFDVSGKFTIEGGRLSPADLAKLRVSFNQNVAQPDPAQPDSFMVRNLQPNRYQIRVDVFPETAFNGYVKAIRIGDNDVRDTGIVLDGPLNGPIEIVIRPDGGSLSGAVMTEQRQPAVNASVVLVPGAPLRSRPDLFKNVRTAADGTFRVAGITPGEYRLYAWSDVEDGAWLDPEFLKDYEDRGDTIRVGEGTAATIQVRVIP